MKRTTEEQKCMNVHKHAIVSKEKRRRAQEGEYKGPKDKREKCNCQKRARSDTK